MSNELIINYTTGATLYALLFDATGQIWNGSAFEVPSSANWTDYDIAMTEVATATGIYRATMPAAAAGVYGWTVRRQAGGSPAVSDVTVGTGRIEWSGTAEIMPASTTNITAGMITTVTNIPTQQVRDAMMLAPTAGSPAAGSVDEHLDDILVDTGTTLPALISAGNAGSGATSYTITVQDEDSNPIDGVEVWITTDSAGTNVVAGTLSTDALGVATFMLDAGDYYVWRQASGYNFTNPVAITVS